MTIDNFLFEHLQPTYKNRMGLINLLNEEKINISNEIIGKLYKSAIERSRDVDYGDIPLSKGDITKCKFYNIIRESIIFLKQINDVAKATELKRSIDIIENAFINVEKYKNDFHRGFMQNSEYLIFTYNTLTLSIISALDIVISDTVEYVRTPDGLYTQIYEISKIKNSTQHQLLLNLEKFNISVNKGEFNKILNVTKTESNFIGASGIAMAIAVSVTTFTLIIFSVKILRELVFIFYNTRTEFSDKLDLLAKTLELHRYEVEANGTIDIKKKQQIIERQKKVIEILTKMSDFIRVDFNKAEKEYQKDMEKDNTTFDIQLG